MLVSTVNCRPSVIFGSLTVDLMALPDPNMTVAGSSMVKIGQAGNFGQKRAGVFGQRTEIEVVDGRYNDLRQ